MYECTEPKILFVDLYCTSVKREIKVMTRIHSNYQTTQQSFGRKLIITHGAEEIINKRFSRVPGLLRTKMLQQYDKFIRKVINSDFDVYVSELADENLLANVIKHEKKYSITYAIGRNNLLAKLGLKNPVKFMEEAFQKALNRTKS